MIAVFGKPVKSESTAYVTPLSGNRRTKTSRVQRTAALAEFLNKAPSLGISSVYLVGSMARNTDADLSDVNLVCGGVVDEKMVNRIQQKIYDQTGVVITVVPGGDPKGGVKVL